MLVGIDSGVEIVCSEETVLPGAPVVVDSVPLSLSKGNFWFIKIKFGDKVEQSIVNGVKTELDVNHTHFGIVGDRISYDLDVTIDSGEMKLSVWNYEASAIDVKFNRIIN